MTRVLLTGAGGLAGHHCLEHLLQTTDWDVVCTDSFRHKGKTDRIAEVLHDRPDWRARVDVITHDLNAPFSRQAFLNLTGPVDYVIAYASESHVDRSIADPVPFVQNNMAVALFTLELCRELKPQAVVWVSTDEVYGPLTPGQRGFREWSPMLPSSPYAASKAAQESVCISYWRTYGVPVVLVNCVNLIGERQDPEKFTPRVIRALARGEVITIHKGGSRYYLHARNLADAVVYLIQQQAAVSYPQHPRPARFNIASADRVANLTMARMIAEAMHATLRYRFEDLPAARPGHDLHYGLNAAKIAALGWKPPVPFRESLERLVQWSLAHKEWLEE